MVVLLVFVLTCKALPQRYRGKWVFPMQVDAEMAYLPDAG